MTVAGQTYRPRNSICEQQMRKELGNIPQFVCFKAMNGIILKEDHKNIY